MANLYEKFGGTETIAAVVEEFYKRVLADDTINHFFKETDMKKQMRHQTAFVSFALGGPAYTGKSMEKAHEGMNLQPEHFDAVATHLAGALAHFNVSDEDINEVLATVGTLREAILYK
ncbi:group 1 truncated hemoglobin [Tumebacillus sp. DT12]|uniref:Group 1 truncated hemoglobin n=1 Tax=Tumebacillus lacus TaxID=2995335 RepID=A0ABT3WZQ4_9BACL|nr:group 1 truncated hemoglobin [Tumebacillus lacus]MCX7570134.1 group 1 truncated hemoglobin [Tumebacillus lacus]